MHFLSKLKINVSFNRKEVYGKIGQRRTNLVHMTYLFIQDY